MLGGQPVRRRPARGPRPYIHPPGEHPADPYVFAGEYRCSGCGRTDVPEEEADIVKASPVDRGRLVCGDCKDAHHARARAAWAGRV